MTERLYNFYVLTNLQQKRVLHISMDRELQSQLTVEFRNQREEFLHGREQIAYKPTYQIEQDEIFKINPFVDEYKLLDIIRSPSSVEALELSAELYGNIKAIFSTSDHDDELIFQCFDQRRVIRNCPLSFWFSGNTFQTMNYPVISLDKKLGVILGHESLLFQSSWYAGRIFTLTPYFNEATDEQCMGFLQDSSFAPLGENNLVSILDKSMRTKICQILETGVLKLNSVHELQNIAATLDYQLVINSDNTITLPNNKRDLKRFLHFFAEDYMRTPITNKLHIVNSKRIL